MEEEIGKPSWPISTAPSQARRPTTRQGEDASTFFSESLPVGPCCHPFPFGPLCFTKTEHGWDPMPLPCLSTVQAWVVSSGWMDHCHARSEPHLSQLAPDRSMPRACSRERHPYHTRVPAIILFLVCRYRVSPSRLRKRP